MGVAEILKNKVLGDDKIIFFEEGVFLWAYVKYACYLGVAVSAA